MIKLHKKYGPVLRIAPDELSYASAQAWQDIYGSSSIAAILYLTLRY